MGALVEKYLSQFMDVYVSPNWINSSALAQNDKNGCVVNHNWILENYESDILLDPRHYKLQPLSGLNFTTSELNHPKLQELVETIERNGGIFQTDITEATLLMLLLSSKGNERTRIAKSRAISLISPEEIFSTIKSGGLIKTVPIKLRTDQLFKNHIFFIGGPRQDALRMKIGLHWGSVTDQPDYAQLIETISDKRIAYTELWVDACILAGKILDIKENEVYEYTHDVRRQLKDKEIFITGFIGEERSNIEALVKWLGGKIALKASANTNYVLLQSGGDFDFDFETIIENAKNMNILIAFSHQV
jgi:NAD-dependent DNA ligase